MKIKISTLLLAAILFQFFVLTGMVAVAAMPLLSGTEIKIKTIPVDPRSLFRGNYARLRYEISQLEIKQDQTNKKLRNGDVVYVQLVQNNSELYEHSGVTLTKPETGFFIRGRIQNKHFGSNQTSYRIKYGIEAFFAPKEKALALEKELRKSAIAVLMISKNGNARLKNIINADH